MNSPLYDHLHINPLHYHQKRFSASRSTQISAWDPEVETRKLSMMKMMFMQHTPYLQVVCDGAMDLAEKSADEDKRRKYQ